MNTSIFSKTLISNYKEQIFSESKCKIDSLTDNTNALRVLFVHDRFAPDYAGGGEYFILRLAQALQLKGVQVSVLTTGDPCITEFEGIRTQRLAVSSYRFNGVWRKVINAAQHVDVIHTFTYHGFLPARIAATILKKPLVCTILAFFDRTWHDMKGPILGRCFQFFEHFILKQRMDAKIFISDYSKAFAIHLDLAQSDDPVLEPGIDLDTYTVSKKNTNVLFSGKLDVRKGYQVVLEAAKRLPEISFRFVVWGDLFDAVDTIKPSNVVMEKMQSREHLAKAMSESLVFVFPSMSETFGLVVTEAMRSGCAVVSSIPLPFLGQYLPTVTTDGFVQALHRLLNNRPETELMGKINREIASVYTWSRHAEGLMRIYKNCSDIYL